MYIYSCIYKCRSTSIPIVIPVFMQIPYLFIYIAICM